MKNAILSKIEKEKGFWSLDDVKKAVGKPASLDSNYNLILNHSIFYTEEEKEALETAAANERGTVRY